MAYAKLSIAQAAAINLARAHAGDDERKNIKREMFLSAKTLFGIPASIKVKAETSNAMSPDYLVLKDSKTGQPFELRSDNKWVNAPADAAPAHQIPVRWFRVAKDTVLDLLKDEAAGSNEFDDGLQALPDSIDSVGTVNLSDTVVLVNGDVFVKLAEYDLM